MLIDEFIKEMESEVKFNKNKLGSLLKNEDVIYWKGYIKGVELGISYLKDLKENA